VSGDWHVPLACATALLVTCLVLSGIRRSNIVNTVIVSLTLLTLFSFMGFGASDAIGRSAENFSPFVESGEEPSWYALCLATALMFVAYTGYGRIATLGEEVKEPRKTIPKAIVLTLLVSALLYIGVSAVAVGVLGAGPFAQATEGVAAPLEVAAGAMSASWVRRLVAVGAMTAMLGVLLNLVLGLSRVLLAMGRRRDMPSAAAKLSQTGNPNVAVVIVGLIIAGLALFGSVKTTWSFSAFTVLVYYAITNLAALRLKAEQRLYPRPFSWAGLIACLGLAFFIDLPVLGAGVLLILLGIGWHHLAKRQSTVG
ncbi:MAG: amino acid permease, partial [Planctomycetes bacterium]|nr:amino acid permease [Planctomycetota bacterium]